MSLSLTEIFGPHQKKIELALREREAIFGPSSFLQKACLYALGDGGKRFRPALAMLVAKALPAALDVTEAALAVEYFHTASLITDDLPSMDNDSERRGKPSTHVAFGESVALLASYALVAAGYQAIGKNCEFLKKEGHPHAYEIGIKALMQASHHSGIEGATGGQYIDLFPLAEDGTTYQEIVLKKTVSLFQLSMAFGWLFGGGDLSLLPKVLETASHFGMAFQIADDFQDEKKDQFEGRGMNAVDLFGKEIAFEMFQNEIRCYLKGLSELRIDTPELCSLAELLKPLR